MTQTREDQIKQDVSDLHGLGYAQELFRSMGGFSNFAISFSIISIRGIGRRSRRPPSSEGGIDDPDA